MEKILEVNGLTKEYSGFRLDNVSFSVEKGSIMGFIGRNGAGKTTTIKGIMNLLKPDGGSVRVFGREFRTAENEIKPRIGYASSATQYYPRKRVQQIIDCTKTFYDTWDDAVCAEYMSLFALDAKKRICELSEGMKVKLQLVLALSHKAELLILDEPTSGLDPVSREELVRIFKKLAEGGITIMFSTHITSDLEKCADSITYIKHGKILASKHTEDFIADYAPEFTTLEAIIVHNELD